MSYEDEDRTDHLHCAKELLGLVDNLHGDELDQTADLERGASAHALVDIAQSFRQFNSDRSQWYREVLEVLDRVTKPDPGPCTSRTPLITFDNGPLPQQPCTLRHGHEGMHESAVGSRWMDEDSGSLRSEQPEAAGVCRACGRTAVLVDLLCSAGPLSYTEWFAHRDEVVRELGLKGVERMEAVIRANKETYDRFGPCPEES